MPRHKLNARYGSSTGNSQARRSIASLAARMMAEDGIADYGFAKRKAARSLGFGDGETLPTNDEVEAELRSYQSLFQDEDQPQQLKELRSIALEVMAFMVDFHPYLTGAVLDGTAGRHSSVELDLFADSAKDVEISLLSRNISYESSEPRHQVFGSPETRLHIDWNGVPVTLSVYPIAAERQQKRDTPAKPTRARASAVAALLAEPQA